VVSPDVYIQSKTYYYMGKISSAERETTTVCAKLDFEYGTITEAKMTELINTTPSN